MKLKKGKFYYFKLIQNNLLKNILLNNLLLTRIKYSLKLVVKNIN
jgi:hypothetical protein